jgi:cytochrome c oxidase cbb3-type subunit 2
LARVGGRYSDTWHKDHLTDPRSVVPESNMPAYPWLLTATVDGAGMAPRMRAMQILGVPYTAEEIAKSSEEVSGKTEMEALIAYLQVLGTAIKNKN